MITKNEKIQKIKDWLSRTVLDGQVVNQTLGVHENHVSPQVLLSASAKLVKINQGNAVPDDRDSLKFSKFLGIEDYVKEHIDKDAGKLQRKAKQKIDQKKDLSWLHAGYFSPQIRSVIIGNSLAQNVEGINPMEHYDVSHRVTKLGPGGIPSLDAVPDESRNVNPSSFGFFDPFHVSESANVGVTNYLVHNLRKGDDGKLYRLMKNKDGHLVWVDHETLLNSKLHIPEH